MIKDYLRLIRANHWIKNLFCFSGLVFGTISNYNDFLLPSFATFICFCFASSSIYIFNDILDKEADLNHPIKKLRPIASGKVKIYTAVIIAFTLIILALIIAYKINKNIIILTCMYIINNFFYNLIFKKHSVIDVLSISFGFIFRLMSGIFAVSLYPTPWIILCTFFLSLFLGFSKRRAELIRIEDNFSSRETLKKYDVSFLDSLINESSFGAIISYSLFCIISKNNILLMTTIPIVYFAITHYKNLVLQGFYGEEPEKIVTKDRKIIISVFLWLVSYVLIENIFI